MVISGKQDHNPPVGTSYMGAENTNNNSEGKFFVHSISSIFDNHWLTNTSNEGMIMLGTNFF